MISYRLESLIKYVDKEDSIIDIGCDHALLDVELIKRGIVKNMIVSDVRKSALDSGINNIKKNKLDKKIDARLGSGLEVLNDKDKVNTIIISGMGTSTILDILNNKYLDNINKLIIQSNNDHTMLRDKVIKLGFYILDEEYFVDKDKNYINIVFIRGNKLYKLDEIKYGPVLIHNKKYLEFEIKKIEKIKKLIPNMKFRFKINLWKESKKLNKYLRRCD